VSILQCYNITVTKINVLIATAVLNELWDGLYLDCA